ncbi:hypothetical protein FIBSPDRAFT_767948 [Athelia psychrophila]|uniref:Uncharacterized protein n=1 Tax=Athelia psychrophila TaxID=1759441 RepID=A0A167UN48_9AGAM|nr:hypothetical protein FIBSPDRAFT_767948 [Fibularhizoctonia sp. CBS 109695]
MRGSKAVTTKLTSVQRKAAKHITGALSLAAADTMEVHAHILPINLLFHKVLYRAAARICTLPILHSLHAIARRTANTYVKCHRSPLHNLFHVTKLRPSTTKTISPTRRKPDYIVPHSTHITNSKDDALQDTLRVNERAHTRVYVDGSGYKGGIVEEELVGWI